MTAFGAGLARLVVVLAVAILVAVGLARPAGAQERILSFDSEIWVHTDSTMTVRETIAVQSAGQKIKRGIYRDFPTVYEDARGNRVEVGFEVLRVLRGGRPEPYHTERRSNGVRVYIGSKDVFIPKGRHTYMIEYRTNRQLGFFDDFDELYWNVTGNGWDFAIEGASAQVHLPEGARVLNHAAYTGRMGEQGQDFNYSFLADGGMSFETTRRLKPREGLTIALSWPAGIVTRPSQAQEMAYLVGDNRALFAGLIGLMLLAAYYMVVWALVGLDPKKGTIVPLYEPPKGFSPAAARYVKRMDFDDKAFTSAIVSMAVKGFLTIREGIDDVYTLEKTGVPAGLSAGERAVARKLFGGSRTEIELKQTNHKKLQAARKALQGWLRTEFEKVYFIRNTYYFLPGVFLSFLAIVALVLASDQPLFAAFICLWLSGWTIAIYYLGRQVWRAWRTSLATGDFLGAGKAFFMTVVAAPFFVGEIVGLDAFIEMASSGAAAMLLGIQIVNLVFYHLLNARAPRSSPYAESSTRDYRSENEVRYRQ